jgi:hypothetical protein
MYEGDKMIDTQCRLLWYSEEDYKKYRGCRDCRLSATFFCMNGGQSRLPIYTKKPTIEIATSAEHSS